MNCIRKKLQSIKSVIKTLAGIRNKKPHKKYKSRKKKYHKNEMSFVGSTRRDKSNMINAEACVCERFL